MPEDSKSAVRSVMSVCNSAKAEIKHLLNNMKD